MPNEERDVEHNGAGVESEDVGVCHQRATLPAEVFAERGGQHAVRKVFLQLLVQFLETGSHVFLCFGVASIEEKKEFPNEILAPRKALEFFAKRVGVLKFTAFHAFEKKEMDVAIVVSQLALIAVETKADHGANHPDSDAPFQIGERNEFGLKTPADGGINANEPNVTGKTVQHASEARLLPGHASQLPVSTVQKIGENEQPNAHAVQSKVGEMKKIACQSTEQNADHRHKVRVNPEFLASKRNSPAERAGEVNVQPFFRVL